MVTPWLFGTEVEVVLASDFGRAVFASSCYEPNELFLLSRLLAPASAFVDVGANMGLYSVAAGALVGSEGTVIAIEPSSRDRALLERNLARNGLCVSVESCALGDAEEGTGQLNVTDRIHPGQNTFGAVIYDKTEVVGRESVRITTLDMLLDARKLTRVDVVKVDVEGAEHALLCGATRTLRELRPILMMELQEQSLVAQGSSAREVVRLLQEHDYELRCYSPPRGPRASPSDLSLGASLGMRPLEPADLARSQDVVAVPAEKLSVLES
ncbi:MAG: FkbM family methyltransferase [Acidimicrobiales bacterium]